MTSDGYVTWPAGTKKGYAEAYEGDGLKLYPSPSREYSGGTVQRQSTNALNTYRSCGSCVVVRNGGALRIRYLTPKECLRLMGQKDDAIGRLYDAIQSDNIRYKLAGNSIVVEVLMALFKGIYIDNSFEQKKTLEDFL